MQFNRCRSLHIKACLYWSFVLLLYCISTNSLAAKTQLGSVKDFLQLSLEELLNVPITSTSFFDETSLTSGSTVSVITPKYWEKRSARRMEDVMQYLPSVNMTPSFLGAKNLVIRGFPNSNGTGVQTLWDGVPINTYPIGNALIDHPNIQLNTLNSIEVIRGPGSALYGSDAFNGVLSLSAFEATSDLNEVKIKAASNGYYNAAYKMSNKIGQDLYLNFAFSGSGQPDQDFEYKYTNAGNTLSSERDYKYNSSTAVIKLFSDPDKSFSYKLAAYKDNYDHDGFFHNGTDVPAQDFGYLDNAIEMLKAETKWQFDSKRSLTFDLHRWDNTHVFSRVLPNLNRIFINTDEQQSGANLVYKDEALLHDTQLSFAVGYRENEASNASRQVVTPTNVVAVDAALLFNNTGRDITSYLLDGKSRFADGEYILRYGFRYDDYSDFGTQFTPRLGLIKRLTKHSVVKLLYGSSFRAPTGNELYGGPIQTGDLNLTPEEIDTYELVYLFENDHRKTEVVIFHSELKNSIQQVDDPVKDFFANVGAENTSEGIEISHYQQLNKIIVDTSFSYVKSRNKTDGYEFGAFPKYIFNLGVGYQFENKWSLLVNNRVHLDADREPSTSTFDAAELRDYWRMDLGLNKKFGNKLDVFLNIRNVLNRQNELPSLQNSPRSTQFLTGIQDEEISFDVGLTYKF